MSAIELIFSVIGYLFGVIAAFIVVVRYLEEKAFKNDADRRTAIVLSFMWPIVVPLICFCVPIWLLLGATMHIFKKIEKLVAPTEKL